MIISRDANFVEEERLDQAENVNRHHEAENVVDFELGIKPTAIEVTPAVNSEPLDESDIDDDHLDDENCDDGTADNSKLNDVELDEAAATPRRSNRQNNSMLPTRYRCWIRLLNHAVMKF